MKETVLSHSMRRLFAGGAAAGFAVLALPVMAQELVQAPDVSNQPVQRVEITGSSIKRLATESALPITTMKASDFAKQGLTTAQDVLNTIPMNQSSQGSSQSVGAGTGGRAVADLRGLGGDKTLVLLNGRRLANHPFFADTIDLNMIPVAALDRVEVLRDGASAIYGTDAIGGVINFITKKSVKGVGVTFEAYEPIHSGGGAEQRFNISGGYGDLNANGYSMFGVADWHQQTALTALDRSFANTGIRPEHGVSRTSGTPFPANFFDATNDLVGNPFFASGCLPPLSVPATGAGNPTCRYDFTRDVDLIPKTNQLSVLGRLNWKFGPDHTGALEYLHSRSTNESRVAPPPMTGIGITMFGTSPFYPGGSAGVPAFPGLTGAPLDISWRPVESGKRQQFDASMTDRVLANLEGIVYGWDYNTAISYSQGRANSAFTGGYLVDQRIIDGVGAGILNPFGAQTTDGAFFLNSSLLNGRFLDARIDTWAIDGHASRNMYALAGGQLGVAFGAEYRHDKAKYNVNRDLAGQASSSGYADAQNQSGQRDIYAVFGEVNAPFTKDLEMNVAARYDHYSDVGGSFNPKVSLRWQPTKQVLARASWNKGFRAPTLFDLFGPQTVTFTSDQYDDPVLCPGGVALPGTNRTTVCNAQQNIQQGGNATVGPETSRTYSAGIVWEPSSNFTASADWWDIKLKDQISFLAEQTIFGNPVKYADLFHYNAAGTELLFVSAITSNLGELKTRGLDVSMLYRVPRNIYGNFTINFDGTYVNKYDFQHERGGPFTQNAGRYADASPVFRWRHNVSLSWTVTDWIISLVNRYSSHYVDQNAVDPAFAHKVAHYSTWTLSGTYTANKKIDFTAGVKNLFDQGPPYTNQGTTFQQGYDPRYTDPLGATIFMRLTYKFL
jgi:iron complex outermembrane receptor protein